MSVDSLAGDVVLEVGARLGEGPLWDEQAGELLFVDILCGTVHGFSPASGEHRSFEAGMAVGAVVLDTAGGLVLAAADGFYSVADFGGALERIGEFGVDASVVRFNDGKVDPLGRFVAGTMPWGGRDPYGALYLLDTDGSVRELLSQVTISNGLAWSNGGRLMYYIDTPTRLLEVFDVDPATGTLARRRTIAEVDGHPDGMAIDDEGMLWVAVAGGHRVERIDPSSGRRLAIVEVPVSQVTSVAFGGAQLDELYITTGQGMLAAGVAPATHAGDLFAVSPGVTGPAAYRYGHRGAPVAPK